MKKGILDYLLIFLTISYFLFVQFLPASWWNQMLFPGRGAVIKVTLPSGVNASAIAEQFEKAGLVQNSRILTRWFVKYGIDRKIQSGKYFIKKGAPWEVAEQMITAKPDRKKITIIPGTEISDLESSFDKKRELILALMDNSNFPDEMKNYLPESSFSRSTMLLPDTYQLDDKSAELLVRIAAKEWWEKIGKSLKEDNLLKEVSTLGIVASLVEKEATWDEDRRLISGVIYNRLEKNMLLQIDASVIFAWKQEGIDLNRVLYKHLEIDSPFNTYLYAGLPPEPICIPSYESWRATINPEKHSFLYYVANDEGKHVFSKTFDEHKRAIRKIRNSVD
jgi:UPF0755 protein